jgi:hypothetical protein
MMKGRRQLTLGIIKPDILVASLPLLLRRRPNLTLQSLYQQPPHILLASTSSSSSSSPLPNGTAASTTTSTSTATALIATHGQHHQQQTEELTPLEEILRMIERGGFEIRESKLMDVSIEQAERFYGEHEGKFFYQRLVAFLTR